MARSRNRGCMANIESWLRPPLAHRPAQFDGGRAVHNSYCYYLVIPANRWRARVRGTSARYRLIRPAWHPLDGITRPSDATPGVRRHLEWSRNSCSPPVVILEETAEPLATLDG